MPDVLLLIESAEPSLSRAMTSTLPFDSPLYLRSSFKKDKKKTKEKTTDTVCTIFYINKSLETI